jgi:L-ascorbate metabolism protein UlaG (beta-lactamase superfamily)
MSKMKNLIMASLILLPFYAQGETSMSNKPVSNMGFFETIKVTSEIFCNKAARAPKSKLPEVKPDIAEFMKPSSNVKFIWFGHSTVMLNIDGKIILLDPVFSDYAFSLDIFVKRFQAPVLKLEELPPIDVIVISHDHYDHLDKKTILHFKDKATGFILPQGVGEHLRDWGIPASRMVELKWNESTTHNGLTFTATPAQHFSGRGLFDHNKTVFASWVIKGQEQKIFFSGDSGYSDHFKQIGKDHGPFDVTFIENGQYDKRWAYVHMQPEETMQAHLDLNGKLFVPIHWGMFDLALHYWSEPVVRTHKLASDWDIDFMAPKLGQIVDIGWTHSSAPWWLETQEQEVEKTAPLGLSSGLNYQSR